jgi:hypothetical protein
MGFHLDTTGNVWLGSGSSGTTLAQAITSGPPNFYVTSLGSIYAAAGTVGGITIDSTGISANYDAGNTGFKIFSSDGSAEFDDVTIRAEIQGSSVTGSVVMGSGGEIKTSSGTSRIEIGNTNETYISFIQGSATTGRIETIAGSGGADTFRISSFLNDDLELYAGGGSGKLEITAGEIYIPVGAALSFSGDSGSPGEVLTRNNAGGANWASTSGHNHTGYSFPNSGTLLSNDNHNHSNLLDGSHLLANNPHSVYVQNANHSHSNFLESADLSSFISNSNSTFNSVVDHTDITANQGGGSAHGLSLSGVNAAVLHVNDNSQHTNHNHNYGLAEDPHGNGEHNEAYITNNNANAHHGNTYALAHNHPYASTSHGTHVDGNVLTTSNHSHNTSAIHTHNTALATDPHGNGDHNAAFITNSNANAHHGNTYANFSHVHINPLTHDSRLLSVNANSVPGLNAVQRMNPVTANFSEQYKNKVLEEPSSLIELNQKTYRLTYQDVKQALEDDGVDTTDIAMIIENVEYANELAPELDDDMKGLMDGEMDAILVQAIKDLSAKIDLLEDRIATLEG